MKKVYFLCLLVCMSIMADAQTTAIIYAVGAPGSYITGSSIQTLPAGTYARNEGIIPVSNTTTSRQTGYAVFDISTIPAGCTVSSVELGVNVFGYTFGTGGTCNTYGRQGSLATVTNATTLFNNCTGTGGTLVASTSYGTTAPVDWTITGVTNPNFQTFMVGQINIVGHQYITMSFSITGATTCPVYNIKGGSGTGAGSMALAGPHAPYLKIVYCFKPIINSASISPASVCTGQTFSLTGTATGAANYRWRGPGGFSTALTPAGPDGTPLTASGTATPASAGTYTLIAYTNCGSYADSTLSTVTFPSTTVLAVNPSPAALITTTTTLCVGDVTNMSDVTAGGAWSSSNNALAIVNTTGMVTAVAGGSPVISYKLGACAANATVTINNPPTPIIGGNEVCASGGTLSLSDAVAGIPNGTWSSSVTAAATVDAITGVVYGIVPGVTDISYFTGACPAVTHPVTVNPLPSPIAGANTVCVNANITLSDATPNGTWSSANTDVSVNPATGVVTGVDSGAAYVTYTLPTGCYVTKLITINFIPEPITGPTSVCEAGSTITLSDPTPGGNWTSNNVPVASITPALVVTGGIAGSANISYTLPVTGCFVTHPVTVNPLPNIITGLDLVCTGASITISNAAPGGQWSSGSVTIATADPATGEVFGVSAGVSWITYTLPTSCLRAFSVTVLPRPPAVITPGGPTTFCTGGSVVLNANAGAGLTYQWFTNHIPAIGSTGTTYTSVTTEVMEVQVTDGNGCINMSDTVQVTLIPSVAILAGGPVVFCQPGNVTLSVPLASSILYQWKLNGVNIPGANAHTWMAVSDGIYTADLVIPGGCASTTPPFVVTVHAMPVPVISFNGTTLSTPVGYLSYQWFLNATAVGPASPAATSITPTTNGSYIVRVLDGNGCVGYSNAYIFNLGVGSVGGSNVNIYPNPANTIVNIDAPVTVRAVITSIDGKTIIDQDNAKTIDISKLSNGLYMIMLYNQNGDRLMIRKLVKE